MTIAVNLFLTFFKIGLFCFGGGYAMVSVIEKDMVALGYLTSAQYADIVAISQVTPGPLAINTATYVGAVLGGGNMALGILYATVATLAVSLPSFILVFIIARFFKRFGESEAVKAVMGGIRPSVIGLIFGAALLFARLSIVNLDYLTKFDFINGVNYGALFIAAAALVVNIKTKINPLWILLGAGIIGIVIL